MRHARPAEPGVWDELRAPAAPRGHAGSVLRSCCRRRRTALSWRPTSTAASPRSSSRSSWTVSRTTSSDEPGGGARPALVAGTAAAADRAGRLGRPSKPASCSARRCSNRCWPTSTARARLLHEGLLPPALLLRHPGYLRPMMGVQPARRAAAAHRRLRPGARARRRAGGWWRSARRARRGWATCCTTAWSSRASFPMPSATCACSTSRPATGAARHRRAAARDVAGGATPRVALLTPGPYSETYFEHAYLARYLGLPLVEGGDLTVRGERLFLKTVEGLEPVHGLLRRLDDDWCDPLELRPDSALGVPGLLQAARGRQRGDGQCPGQRLPRVAGDAGLPARHRAGACSATTCCCRRCPPGGAAKRRPGATCSGAARRQGAAQHLSARWPHLAGARPRTSARRSS